VGVALRDDRVRAIGGDQKLLRNVGTPGTSIEGGMFINGSACAIVLCCISRCR
jgi:hypothetical protein